MNRIIFFLLTLMWVNGISITYAQNSSGPIRLSEASFSMGGLVSRTLVFSAESAIQYCPTCHYSSFDYQTFHKRGSRYWVYPQVQRTAQLSLGLRRNNSENQTRLSKISSFQIGIMFLEREIGYSQYHRRTSDPVDTLTSSVNGSQYAIDSVNLQEIGFSAEQFQLLLSSAWMVDLVKKPHLEFQAGLGIAAGFTFNDRVYAITTTQINYQERDFATGMVNPTSDSLLASLNTYSNTGNGDFHTPRLAGLVSVPLTVTYLFGNPKSESLRIGLMYSCRPAISLVNLGSASVLDQQIGIKVQLPDKGSHK